ncbi:cupin domain-containing protein [Paenirhodobacter populi]|uniref:Cupin domain-containing protein n=1 Tax=Paenirhodobacter populi TaxID=2306993 RepID=A0A443J774_9RHOB|nr:cupin domain-containing protein [Sinirhodobacter populi]RWR05610.1 cupin domain-containing protein [Sinirhodobacter populi]RWR16222.1 cupin domain-containing protein [Sinirhodobacter populi]
MTEPQRGVTPSARDVINTLGLKPHPEGGWYAETFRDAAGAPRGHSTAIYYLLEAGQRSHWHRVKDATEIWHFHAGAALSLILSPDGRDTATHRLGTDFTAGERPQLVVPAGWWQTAEPLGPWTLVGCTVAPGFLFEQFELAPEGWTPQRDV